MSFVRLLPLPLRSGVSLALLVSASALQGQLSPGNIVPNYDRVRIGQVEGLEGGAYVARTGDAGANWYNPAGLALADNTSLNASTNAYEYTTVRLEGLDRAYSAGRFQSLGTYFAGVIGSPFVDDRRLRFGFSFTRPVLWAPGAISGRLGGLSPETGGEVFDFYSKVEMSVAIPAVAAGFRVSDRVRVGLGLGVPITSLKAENQSSNLLVDAASVRRASSSVSLDGQLYQLHATAGVQWDVNDRVRTGLTITSPGVHLSGSSLLAVEQFVSGPAGVVDVGFRDAKAAFDPLLPLRIVGGISGTFGRLEIEADVRWYGSRSGVELLSSEEPYTVVTTAPGGPPTVIESTLGPAVEEIRSVTNLALGANYALSGNWVLHGGVFIDNSPVGDPGTSIFQAVDLHGLGLAVSFGGQLSGTVGVSSNWGTTNERSFGPSLGGVAGATRVEIETFNLHYALSYTFD